MTTKLDELVGYLAGRDGNPRVLDELADPDSEASLFLEAARIRSKSLIQEPVRPKKSARFGAFKSSIGSPAWAGVVVVAVAMAIAFWFIDARLKRMEVDHQDAAAQARESSERLISTLEQVRDARSDPTQAEQNAKILARVEAELARLEGRLEPQERSPASTGPDPLVAPLREEISGLRRDLIASDKARIRQAEELQSSIHEVGRLLRLLLTRLEPAPTPADPPRTFPQNRPQGALDPRR